eukprot:Seg3040.3 transcript_id=Seg3040.3/GoldUCD/mRNA.D3Y31 product="Beta-1 adrenergic receptor" protein_id=Seg3040.3/GoldUCD/D3Y31
MANCIFNLNVPTTIAYILAVVNIVQCFASSVGNFIVLYIIGKSKRLHTRSYVCLVSLAITDFLVGLVLEPLHVMQLLSAEYRSNCKLNVVRRFLLVLLLGASISSIAVVSYDRYKHLSKTVNYRQYMSKKKIACLLMISWLAPMTVPFAQYINEAVNQVIVIAYIFMVIGTMITCYVLIIRIVKNQEDSLKVTMNLSKSQARSVKSHIKAAKAIILINLSILATFTPTAIYFAVGAISNLLKTSNFMSARAREIIYAFCITVAMANSAVNPIIYCLRIPEFRERIKRYAPLFFSGFVRVAPTDSKFERTSRVSTV